MKRVFALLLLLVCISGVAPLHAQTPPPTTSQPWYERYQQAWSTGLSAFVGFAGLIAVTMVGFRQNKKMQQTQAKLDREAQERHWRKEYERQDRDQAHELQMEENRRARDARALANALAAELRHIRVRVTSFVEQADEMAESWEELAGEAPPGSEPLDGDIQVSWHAPCHIYSSNTHRFDELPDNVAFQVITAYAHSWRADHSENTTPGLAAISIRMNKELGKIALQAIIPAIDLLDAFRQSDKEPELDLKNGV